MTYGKYKATDSTETPPQAATGDVTQPTSARPPRLLCTYRRPHAWNDVNRCTEVGEDRGPTGRRQPLKAFWAASRDPLTSASVASAARSSSTSRSLRSAALKSRST